MVGMILRLVVELMMGREFCVPWDGSCASCYCSSGVRSEEKGSGVRTRVWGVGDDGGEEHRSDHGEKTIAPRGA